MTLVFTFAGVNWLQCLDRFAGIWILVTSACSVGVLPESGFTAFWTLSISWSRQYSCANSLNISIHTFCVIGYFMLLDIEQITGYRYLCVGGYRTDHRTDHRTHCSIQWTNLTVSYSGQVRLVSLLYHCMYC